MLMGPYKDVYSRIYIFSPSCAPGVDSAWDAWRKHVREYMKVPDDEQTMWSTWEPQILEKLIKRHAKVNAHLKAQGKRKGFVIATIVDDFADSGDRVMHSSTNVLTSLFVRGRHLGCACWLLTQKNRVVSLICRTNYCWMLIWRLRSAKEREQILEELDALMPKTVLLQLYNRATDEKHSFWFVNLLNEKDAMFYRNFSDRMLVVDKDAHDQVPSASTASRNPGQLRALGA